MPPTVVSSRNATALLTIIAAAFGMRDIAIRARRPEPVIEAADRPALLIRSSASAPTRLSMIAARAPGVSTS